MRCYVIGNGITLVPQDLDLLIGKPSFACNRINLIYQDTKWRPTVYTHPEIVTPDLPYIQENVDMGILCYLGEWYQKGIHPEGGIPKDASNVNWINDCHHYKDDFTSQDVPDEWHLPQPCSFGGSVCFLMQVAILLGYDDIILLGCDLLYRDHKQSHFDPRYEHGGEQSAFMAARNALWGHILGKNWIARKGKGIQVRNATRGGLLEIWPRVRLEDVVCESG